jgi:hypothetical protein
MHPTPEGPRRPAREPEPREIPRRLSWELVGWELLAALEGIGAWGPGWTEWIHAPVGLIVTLIAPGYLLLPWVHPRHVRQSGAERWFLTLLLSMAVTMALGLVYAYLHIRLTGGNVALGQAGFLTLEVGAATLTGRYRPLANQDPVRGRGYKILAITVGLLGLVTFAIGQFALAPRPALYVTDRQGHLEHFPYAVPYGATATVAVHVTGPAGAQLSLIETLNGKRVALFHVSLGRRGMWSRSVPLPTASLRRLMTVQFILVGPRLTRRVWIHYWTGLALP